MTVVYLTVEDLLDIATTVLNSPPKVRDYGLLAAAAARPASSAFGQDAYPDLASKAAALLHSVCTNHALIDGNKRLAWVATRVFVGLNSATVPPDIDVDRAEEFMLMIASGNLNDVTEIAYRLRSLGVVE